MNNQECKLEMPAELKTRWLEALRSGSYKQATSRLYNVVEDGYCCLGVLMSVVDGDKVDFQADSIDEAGGLPSWEWYDRNGMSSFHIEDYPSPTCASTFITRECILSFMNDGYTFRNIVKDKWERVYGKSFLGIADYIEANVRGY